MRSASEDELVGELLCESELLKVKPGFSFDEDVSTDSEEVGVCGSVGTEAELSSEHASSMAIGKAIKIKFFDIRYTLDMMNGYGKLDNSLY